MKILNNKKLQTKFWDLQFLANFISFQICKVRLVIKQETRRLIVG